MDEGLVFDIGFHNGNDTAHYLARGFRVVAVEANPTLVAAGQERFADAIKSGRLTLLGVGISRQPGEQDFYVNDGNSEWSSFLPSFGQRGSHFTTIRVPTMTFASLIAAHGVPFYAKIDVEGADWDCLNDLPAGPPRYVSVEAHRLEYLAVLYAKGYRRFKIVNQTGHAGFPSGSSGPISDTIVDWENLETVAYDWLHMELKRPERSSLADGWYDFSIGSARRPRARQRRRQDADDLSPPKGKIASAVGGAPARAPARDRSDRRHPPEDISPEGMIIRPVHPRTQNRSSAGRREPPCRIRSRSLWPDSARRRSDRSARRFPARS